MTPFKRKSSPLLNVIWSFVNIVVGLYVLNFGSSEFVFFPQGDDLWAFIVGGFALAVVAAWLFGRPNARLPWHKD